MKSFGPVWGLRGQYGPATENGACNLRGHTDMREPRQAHNAPRMRAGSTRFRRYAHLHDEKIEKIHDEITGCYGEDFDHVVVVLHDPLHARSGGWLSTCVNRFRGTFSL